MIWRVSGHCQGRILIPEADVSLTEHHYLGLQSSAQYYCVLTDDSQAQSLWHWANSHHMSITPLGSGSNVVLQARLPGLVVHVKNRGVTLLSETATSVELRVAAGENWHELVMTCVTKGYFGLENLALIPGTVGAAPVQNIGAYGVEVCRHITAVNVLDLASGAPLRLDNGACDFRYRDSIFKSRERGRYLILSVDFVLSKIDQPQVEYPPLVEALTGRSATGRDVLNAVVALRREKLPDPEQQPNVGSFFKNPQVSPDVAASLIQAWPYMPQFPGADTWVKLSAAWLLEHCGWRGRSIGGVMMSAQHALVLVNQSAIDANALLSAVETIVASVEATFGVRLVMEPDVLGTSEATMGSQPSERGTIMATDGNGTVG